MMPPSWAWGGHGRVGPPGSASDVTFVWCGARVRCAMFAVID